MAVGFLLTAGSVSHAHPPQAMALTYDGQVQVLAIHMRHATNDRRKDYIRKLVIRQNGTVVLTRRYNIQSTAVYFDAIVELTAEAGDVITVKAYSREGGSAEGTLTVPSRQNLEAVEAQLLETSS